MDWRKEKRDALASFCESTLTAVKSGLEVSKRWRLPATPNASRADRVGLMGDPAYYLEIHAGGSGSEDDQAIAQKVDHFFQVSLWLGYEDNDSYSRSSQSTWDNLVEGASGLLPKLRAEPRLQTASGPTSTLWQPQSVTEDIVALSNRGQEKAHYLTLEIGMRHLT